MPSVSKPQQHLMSAVSHGWKMPGGKGPSKKVADEFHKADLTKADKLKKLYAGGSFKDRKKNFDDGGSYLDYASAGPGVGYMSGDNSGAPTASDISGITGAGSWMNGVANGTGVDTPIADQSGAINSATAPSAVSTDSSSGTSTSALGALMKALGLNSSSAAGGVTALAGILGAVGKYKQNQQYMPQNNPPPLFGGAAGSGGSGSAGANGSAGGYGPPGGYNFRNYQGVGASTPGLGYAPRSQVTPNIPNYYTYGQSGAQPFYTGTSGAVPAAKRGGRIMKKARGGSASTPQRFDAGGMMGRPPMPQMQPQMAPPQNIGIGAPPQAGVSALGAPPPRPPMMPQAPGPMNGSPLTRSPMLPGRGPEIRPGMGMPTMAPPQMGIQPIRPEMRPMMRAEGGDTMPPQSGALSSVSRHVKGPGDGTSDSIPARLANGEYVMDAQTVSMLGNGDNGSGAKQLDTFRENIRKHKGAALANGKMAPDAHPNLMRYLGGKV